MQTHYFRVLLICALLTIAYSTQAQVFVDVNATGVNNGSSWANAYTDLQPALDNALAGEEIWVAQGTYLPTEEPDGIASNPRERAFHLANKNLRIYGGFDGTETLSSQRDWKANPTILSGDLNGDDTQSGSGPSLTFTNNFDNSFHVFVTVGLGSNTALDGFIIMNGNANLSGTYTYASETIINTYGAGLYNAPGGSPTLSNLVFLYNRSNSRGGGMHNDNCSPNINDVTFTSNQSGTGGGLNNESSSPNITNTIFFGNLSTNAAGMANTNSSPTLVHVNFVENYAANRGGGIYNFTPSGLDLSNCIFYGNISVGGEDDIENSPGPNPIMASYSAFEDYNFGAAVGCFYLTTSPFIDQGNPDGPDNVWMTLDDGLTLINTSPCAGAGNGAAAIFSDVAGRVRPSPPSIGAYETVPPQPCQVTTTLFVNQNSTGSNDGSSWADAFTELQPALDCADPGDTIWVAQGIYLPTEEPDGAPAGVGNERYRAFHIANKDIKIYGGFDGTETSLNQRNWQNNPTILSGDFNTDDIVTGSGASLDISMNSENAYHVFLTVGLDGNTEIDGFSISGGHANFTIDYIFSGETILNNYGAGLYNVSGLSPKLSNLLFFANETLARGGGMFNDNCSPEISQVVFTRNRADNGAGLRNEDSSPSITNCVFSGNRANLGGGIANANSTPTLVNLSFYENYAFSRGGAIFNWNPLAYDVINCVFYGNTGGISDNDIYFFSSPPPITVSHCAFEDYNFGASPGCFYLTASPFTNEADPDGLDNSWMTADDGLGIPATSPCSGNGTATGAPVTDIMGTTRPNPPSIGAYEAPVAPCQAATLLYVDLNAIGLNDGTSWTDAFTDLQPALDCADAGDTIWVAQGTYLPTEEPDGAPTGVGNERYRSFHIANKDVKIYGGFVGTETLLSQRNWQLNTTILSGDFNGDDIVTGAGASLSFTNNGENANHVVITVGLTTNTELDGFGLLGGNADVPGNFMYELESIKEFYGGGIYNIGSSSPTLTNLNLSLNSSTRSGGAMCNESSSSPNISNVVFSRNNATLWGGGIYNIENSSSILTNVTFSENNATEGGGISNRDTSSPILSNVLFLSNNASSYGGGMYNREFSSPTLTNVTFSSNSASRGGGLFNYDNSSPILLNATFSSNIASGQGGGGMYNFDNASPSLTNVTFSANNASNQVGGGMYNRQSSFPNLVNVTFSANNAFINGGGIYNFDNASPNITNALFFSNTSPDQNDIYNDGTSTSVSFSAFEDYVFGAAPGCFYLTASPFVNQADPDGPDNIWMNADDGLVLMSGSPPVGAGTAAGAPLNDITGLVRPNPPSIGAYEEDACTPTNSTDTQTACDSLTWINGNTYTISTNTPMDTLTNAAGCDSIVTLNLTINNSSSSTDTHVVCDSLTWIDGNTYTVSTNTPTFTLTTAAGCDSIVTLNLTVNNSSSSIDTRVVCDSLTWIDGNTYTSSTNSPTFTLTNAAGCDSVVSLNLTVNSFTTATDTHVVCDSLNWLDGNTYFSTTNSPSFTTTNANGCDSIITLNLTVSDTAIGTDTQIACDSLTWLDGNTYTSSTNTPTFFTTTSAGCDSLVTLNLTINNSNSATDSRTVCDSLTWIDGNTYTSSTNTPTFTLTNAAGCDSLVSLNLTINSFSASTDVQTACDSYTWIDGNTYTATTNTPTFTTPNASGCDSIISLDLTINNADAVTDTLVACDSLTWINGITYTSSTSTPSVTLINAAGCDSVVSLDLTIFYTNQSTDAQTACDSLTWINGLTYYASTTTPKDTLTNSLGCDSIVSLNLTILNSSTGIDVVSACDSITWLDGNTYTSANNTATFLTTNSAGCDSLVTLDFSIIPPTTGIDSIVSCGPVTWIDGLTYNSSNNTATATLTGSNGCDSLVTLNLIVNAPSASTDTVTACGLYTWIDGNVYSASNNTATYLLTNAVGCDSLITLDLTLNSLSLATDTIIACDQYTWIDGNTYTSANNTASFTYAGGAANGCDSTVLLDLTLYASEGHTYVLTECDSFTWVNGVTYTSSILQETYVVPGATSDGCDSLYYLDLTIIPSGSSTDVITACNSYTWIDGITYTSDNNTATYLVAGGNQNGCDALMTLDLTIENTPTINISSSNGVLSATPGLNNYQWYRNGVALVGATSESFTPNTWGLYTCSTIDGLCEGFSNGIVISITSLKDAGFDYVGIYPNPVNDFMRIDVANETLESIRLIDVAGKVISNLDAKQREFYMGDYARGIYYIQLSNKSKQSMVKIILD